MLYLVRHGQTQWNEQKRLQGSSDSPLTAAGIEQARNVGRALKSLIGDVTTWTLEASPLPRARISAEIIRGELAQSADVVLDERLREVSLGSWEGLTEEEIDIGWPEARIRMSVRRAWASHCPDGESLESARARLTDRLRTAKGNRIVVSHGIAGSLLRGVFAGLTDAETLALPVQHNAIFALHSRSITSFPA